MKSFIYTGPLSGVSLKDHGDVMLVPGGTVQLPEENYFTARLIRKGWLQEVEIPAQEKEPETVEDIIEHEPAPAPDKKRRK